MTEAGQAGEDRDALAAFERVIDRCDDFEAAWRGGRRPRIEDHMAGVPKRERPALLRELLALELELRQEAGERPAPHDYDDRFPGEGAAVAAAFDATTDLPSSAAARPSSPSPAQADADRNLLFGILAVQMGFITCDQLVAAMDSWVLDKTQSLGQVLVARGAIDPTDRALLEPMIARHIQMHGDDPAQSLAALGSVSTASEDLRAVADPDVHASLDRLALDTEAARTGRIDDGPTPAMGESTSGGGRFRILRFHDRGALGEVFLARDTELHREVALKQIKDEHADDARRRARFLLEAEITGGLEHPGIVPVYGLGQHDNGRPFYAMRFIQGDNLKGAIEGFHRADAPARDQAERALELRRLLGRFLDVCNAVAYAHSRGVLHRDLKPGNIMLGPFGETLVVDWGLAKSLNQPGHAGPDAERTAPGEPESGAIKSTELGERLGTPAFMSPEQAAGRFNEVGPASDVYSLGATLYCLLTGKTPFSDRDLADLLGRVERGEFPPPRAVNPRVHRALDAICRKAMARHPWDRYGSPRALADDIEHWLADDPVSALAESRLERLSRWARRHRPWARAGAVALLLVTSVSILAAGLVNQARNRAEERRHEAETLRGLAERRRQEVDIQRLEAERRLARLALDQGLNLADQGDSHRGLLWLARALEIAPADADDLRHVIRLNLERWSQRFHRLMRAVEHDLGVHGVAFSPDGKTLATTSYDATARLWDAATLKPVGPPMKHEATTWAVVFSPDGKTLATASEDCTARLWEAASGRPIGAPLHHPSRVRGVAFSPDGKILATGSEDARVRLWDAATLKPIGLPLPRQGRVVAFSPDGRLLATSSGATGRLWDAATLTPIGPSIQHRGLVVAMAFSPDGKIIATGSEDCTARLWETATLRPISPPLRHWHWITALAFSPDGKTLATASRDTTARFWDVASARPVGPPLQHQGWVRGVAFHPDGKTLATTSLDRSARLWDTASVESTERRIKLDGWVRDVAFSPDGKTLATASDDMTARLWDVATLRPVAPPLKHRGLVRAVAFRPDGKVIATRSDEGTPRFWDAATFQPLASPLPDRGALRAFTFSPCGRYLATSDFVPAARIWEASTGRAIGLPLKHRGEIRAVAFRPDGEAFATASDQTAQLWDTATGQPFGPPMKHHGAIEALAFDRNGAILATTSDDLTARLWDTTTGKPIGPPLKHRSAIQAVAFSPDGKVLATGSVDTTARFWDTATGKPIGPALQHQQTVTAVVFHPDGKLLATASGDNTAQLWDVPTELAGASSRIVLWAQVLSTMELDASDATSALNARDWARRREEWEATQSPPGPIPR